MGEGFKRAVAAARKTRKRGRSAATGEFIPLAEAKGSPEAVVETVAKTVRCDQCDNGIKVEWNYCPYCGTRQRQRIEKPADV